MGTQEQEKQEVRIIIRDDGSEEAVGLDGITTVDERLVQAVEADERLLPHVLRHVGAKMIGHELEDGPEPPKELATAMLAVKHQLDKLRAPDAVQ